MREKNVDEREIEVDNQAIVVYFGNVTRRQERNECLYQW